LHIIVFSHFDQDFFDEKILPKLEELGFDEIRSWSICAEENETRHSSEINLSNMIVVFQDMTTKFQRDALKELMRKTLKPMVFVSSKNPNWDKEVAKKMPPVKDIGQAKLTASCMSEDQILLELTSKSQPEPAVILIPDSKEREPSSELREMLELYTSENEKLVQKLINREELISNLRVEKNSFSKAVEDLTKELGEVIDSRNYVNNLRSEIMAIVALSKDGVLSDSEVLKQFFLIAEDLNASRS
jgi:hypothetical protein